MIKANRFLCRRAMTFRAHGGGALVSKESHLGLTCPEKIMTEAVVTDPRLQRHAQKITVKSDRSLQIVGDEGKMINTRNSHGGLLF